MLAAAHLIGSAEHGGELTVIPARPDAMSDDAQEALPPLGEFRPTRDNTDAPEGQPASPSAHLPAADPEAAPQPVANGSVRHTASVLLALAAHVLILLALVAAPPTELGDGGHALEAISVSIIPASALSTLQPNPETSESAAPAQIAPNAGDDSTASASTPEKIAPREPQIEPPSKAPDEPDNRLAAPAEPAPEVVPEEAAAVTTSQPPPETAEVAVVEPPAEPRPVEKEEPPHKEDPAEASAASSAPGGAVAHGSEADLPPRPAAAAASRGEVNAYGLAVQSALLAVDQREAKARASASQARGTVVVRLVIDGRGALERAEVVQSSGRPQLDEAALQLIRLAAFPLPPPGLTADQRSYLAPIRFR